MTSAILKKHSTIKSGNSRLPSTAEIDKSISDLVAPYVVKELGRYSREPLFTRHHLLEMTALLVNRKRNVRSPELVKEAYEEYWRDLDLRRYLSNSSDTCLCNWDGRLFEMGKLGTKRVYLYLLGRILESLKPNTVLEVGSGIGVNLAYLCRKYDVIEFSGLELTKSGVERAADIIENLPTELIKFYPSPVSAEKNFVSSPVLYQASALDMPFKDGAFEFVYSVQALEQMNRIRHDVIREMYRVSSQYACFIEAFRDYNKGSLTLNMMKRDYFRGSVRELDKYGFSVERIYDNLPTKNKMKIVCVVVKKH